TSAHGSPCFSPPLDCFGVTRSWAAAGASRASARPMRSIDGRFMALPHEEFRGRWRVATTIATGRARVNLATDARSKRCWARRGPRFTMDEASRPTKPFPPSERAMADVRFPPPTEPEVDVLLV